MNLFNYESVLSLVTPPSAKEELEEWLLVDDFIAFLESELNDEYVIIYASAVTRAAQILIHAVVVPEFEFTEENIQDVLSWSGNPYTSWGVSCSRTEIEVESPLSGFGGQVIPTGEQIVFGRCLDGVKGYENIYEINQKFCHVLGLFYMPERRAWSKLDSSGDIEDGVKIITERLPDNRDIKLICARKDLLEEYLTLTDQTFVRMADFMRYRPDFSGWPDKREYLEVSGNSVWGELGNALPVGSFFKGVQLADLRGQKSNLIKKCWGEPIEDKQYVSLIAQDFKHKTIGEVSCDPKLLDSYFNDTGKPFETTPAFFNAEVLRKYKADSEKYTLSHGSVSCRNSWYLRSYSINKAGQVSAYLCDLNQLPYQEQLHWKQYNERPKAPISKAAFEADFLGQFPSKIDPILSLKDMLSSIAEQNKWWVLRSQDDLDRFNYPFTESKDEWAEELMNFDKLLIEGLQEKWLKKKAVELGVKVENKFRALKLIELILIETGFEPEHAYQIMSVFHEIHNYRSIVKGHSSGETADQLKKKTISEHGSFKNHFIYLIESTIESMSILSKEFE